MIINTALSALRASERSERVLPFPVTRSRNNFLTDFHQRVLRRDTLHYRSTLTAVRASLDTAPPALYAVLCAQRPRILRQQLIGALQSLGELRTPRRPTSTCRG